MVLEFNPFQLPDDAFGRALRDVEEFDQVSWNWSEPKWKYLARKHLQSVKYSPKVTKRYLNHAHSKKRLRAASLVAYFWDYKEMFGSPCLKLAFGDPEPVVRGAAIRALSKLYLHGSIHDPTAYLRKLLRTIQDALPEEDLLVDAEILERLVGVQEPLPEEDPDLETLETRVVDLLEKIDHDERKGWQDLAGTHLEAIIKDVSAATKYLSHSDPRLRRVALSFLSHGKRTPEFAKQCENFLINDPDPAMRATALDILSDYYRDSDDLRIGDLMARIVYDDSKPIKLRKSAYLGLFFVRGMPRSLTLSIWKSKFPDDVDWSFVNTFLDSPDARRRRDHDP